MMIKAQQLAPGSHRLQAVQLIRTVMLLFTVFSRSIAFR